MNPLNTLISLTTYFTWRLLAATVVAGLPGDGLLHVDALGVGAQAGVGHALVAGQRALAATGSLDDDGVVVGGRAEDDGGVDGHDGGEGEEELHLVVF